MTKFKIKPLLSLLLALVMVLTMLPMSTLAAEAPETEADAVYNLQPDTESEICTDEACTYEHKTADVYNARPDVDTTELLDDVSRDEKEPDSPVTIPTASEIVEVPTEKKPVPETPIDDGIKTESLSGYIGDSSVAWALNAETGRIFISGGGYVEAFFSSEDQPWREVREQITSVRFELNAVLEIYDLCYWFDGCVNLSDIAVPVYVSQICPMNFAECDALRQLTYGGVDVLAEITADYSNQIDIEPADDETADNGIMLLSSSSCGVLQCTCTRSCSWGYRNYRVAAESNNYHIMTVYCNTCGRTDGIIVSGSHSYSSNGYCSLCGYYNSAYDTTICYHTTTKMTWVTSCYWEKYCSNCGAYVSSGTTHGPYTYGRWSYYSSSQHRRSYSCSYGDSGTYYEYGSHSTSTSYSQHSSTQHNVSSYCTTCETTISTSYASHSFQYGAWENYSDAQHRRLKTCSVCGYSEYEYSSHNLSYGSWMNYSSSQHRRTTSCVTCGYSTYEYTSHSLSNGIWASISDTQHQRTNSCSCVYSTIETASHADVEGDGNCDSCGYLLTHLSVTVPASLTLTVSKHGEVYAATNAAIVNHSTGAVEITAITVSTANGWTLVPYSTNLASAKVDSKQIGFSINSAASSLTGTLEALSLDSGWTISPGASLSLTYDAVVSATSTILNEQVLTVVFVIDWQSK